MSNAPSRYGLPTWFVPALNALVIEVFLLLVLGASVRVWDAGLACPDWPLCFGDVIPDYHPQVYLEFIHRVMAGLVSISTVVFVVMLVRSQAPRALKNLGVGTLLLLVSQVIFGGLTVLMKLHDKVVAAHLGMGVAFFSLLLWIYLCAKHADTPRAPSLPLWAKRLSVALIVAVFAQMILGGLVASNYAALACPDFPTCHGRWFPAFTGPIGFQVLHRLGAYLIFALILGSWLALRKLSPRLGMLMGWMLLIVSFQVAVGIANVIWMAPPLVRVLHLAIGAAVLSVCVRVLHETWVRHA